MTDGTKLKKKTGDLTDIRISVLAAVYNPNLEWLRQQLASIHRQTFPAFEVILMDDASDAAAFGRIQEITAESFGRQKRVFVHRSSRNEGSNRTFEKLVQAAAGNYLAFCDQDDIWEAGKLEKLAEAVKKEHAVMAYSDMSVINAKGRRICPSLRGLRKGISYVQGDFQTAGFLADNCAAGCSMLVRADLARRALPFDGHVYCDQWVAACVSAYGRTVFVDQPLVRYRRHGTNQTGSLQGIESRRDYYEKRVLPMCRLVEGLKNRGIHYPQEEQMAAFAAARRERNVWEIFRYRAWNKKYAYFDILMICLPDFFAAACLHLAQAERT